VAHDFTCRNAATSLQLKDKRKWRLLDQMVCGAPGRLEIDGFGWLNCRNANFKKNVFWGGGGRGLPEVLLSRDPTPCARGLDHSPKGALSEGRKRLPPLGGRCGATQRRKAQGE
jgi:hypothetical protein